MLTMIRAVFLYGELYFQIGELDSESVLRLSLALSSNLNVHNSLSIFHSFFYIFWATMRRISSGIQCEGCLPTPPPPPNVVKSFLVLALLIYLTGRLDVSKANLLKRICDRPPPPN